MAHTIPFVAEHAEAAIAEMPAAAAVFALSFGAGREPYIARTADLRRRLQRVLAPEGAFSKRLNLLPFVESISWTCTGSDFEASLLLYTESMLAFGTRARKRLRLRPPAFLRLSVKNRFPRLYVTNKVTRTLMRDPANATFGPFATRAAAERYCDAVLDLFQLRRCEENLAPYAEHPGCAYGEMKKCLAPCKLGCTEERYTDESAAVFDFLRTGGRSLLAKLEAERAAASEQLDFEQAAVIHGRYAKAEAVAQQAPEAVRLLSELSAVVIQPSAEPWEVSLFCVREGAVTGPVPYSTRGMRLHNEQSGSSSLFSHPVALAPVPLEPVAGADGTAARTPVQERLTLALASLESHPDSARAGYPVPLPAAEATDALALFARWYYRPVVRRVGEVIFAETDGPAPHTVPHKKLLRAISRVAGLAAARTDAPQAKTDAPSGA
ncbi:MAG: excinuclease ABC subunit C [Acidobacteriaceae bacterium]